MWSHVTRRHPMARSENGNLRFVIESIKVLLIIEEKILMINVP